LETDDDEMRVVVGRYHYKQSEMALPPNVLLGACKCQQEEREASKDDDIKHRREGRNEISSRGEIEK